MQISTSENGILHPHAVFRGNGSVKRAHERILSKQMNFEYRKEVAEKEKIENDKSKIGSFSFSFNNSFDKKN